MKLVVIFVPFVTDLNTSNICSCFKIPGVKFSCDTNCINPLNVSYLSVFIAFGSLAPL